MDGFTPQSGACEPTRRDEATSVRRTSVWQWLLPLTVAVMTILAFVPALDNEFLSWDDDENFLTNEHLRPLSLEQLEWCLTTRHMGVWQPVAWILISLEYSVAGLNPAPYRVVSIALHAVNALVLYWLTILILRLTSTPRDSKKQTTRSVVVAAEVDDSMRWGAAIAALVFAVHPLRVEAVGWASCQPYLPAALFFMLAIRSYLKAHSTSTTPYSRRVALAAVWVFYLLAVMSKAAAIMLPAVLVLLDYYPLRRLPAAGGTGRRQWFSIASVKMVLAKWPFALPAVLTAIMAIWSKLDHRTLVSVQDYGILSRIGQAAYGFWFYLLKTILPIDLSPFYVLPKDASLWDPEFLAATIALVVVMGIAFVKRRPFIALWTTMISYIIILLPNSHIFRIGLQMAADRYCYIAALGWWILLGGGVMWLYRARQRQRITRTAAWSVIGLFTTAIVALLPATWIYLQVWRDSKSLWSHTLALDPRCEIASLNIANLLFDEDQRDEAIEIYKDVIRKSPGYLQGYLNLGNALTTMNRLQEAAYYYEQALHLDPDNPELYGGLADVYTKSGQYERAIELYRHSVALEPNDQVSFHNMGIAYEGLEDWEQAKQCYRWAIESDPRYAQAHYDLGRVLHQEGRLNDAARQYRLALDHDPELAEAASNLGNILYNEGRLQESATVLMQALQADPNLAVAHYNLALTRARLGEKDLALTHLERCRQLGLDVPEEWIRQLQAPPASSPAQSAPH